MQWITPMVVETASIQDDPPLYPDTPHQVERWVPSLLEELVKGDKLLGQFKNKKNKGT
jgi:hypothetical protein